MSTTFKWTEKKDRQISMDENDYASIAEIICYDLADGSVFRDKVCELQTPGTPVATHLTDNELAFGLGFHHSLVYLFDGINVLVINLLQRRLGISC